MAEFDRSPPKPWTPGRHPTYTAYTLVVHVCEDEHGRVWSDHEFFTEGDALVAAGTRNGGVEQVAHALLTEALRREAFVDLLVKVSHDPALLGRLQQPAQREAMATEIEGVVARVITQVLPKALPGLVRGVLDMIVASKA
ncbi:MAG: hypothetical protein A2Y38_07225 [Spirochaetes bacterium GWB1_59_5]|nr:MAG: hypothetical protein A2Y38_07225 [Spirochaetes bacterium GWB1_59_5]